MLINKSRTHFQFIKGTSVCNLHPFGDDLQQFSLNNADILEGNGYMDGGCLAFASAVSTYLSDSDTRIMGVASKRGVEHAVVELTTADGVVYLDADGLACKEEVMEKMRRLENIVCGKIAPLGSNNINNYEDKVDLIVNRLFEKIGEPSSDQVNLNVILNIEDPLGKVVIYPPVKEGVISPLELRLLEDIGIKAQRVITGSDQQLHLISRTDIHKFSHPKLSDNDLEHLSGDDLYYLSGDKLRSDIGVTSILRQILKRGFGDKFSLYKRNNPSCLLDVYPYGVRGPEFKKEISPDGESPH